MKVTQELNLQYNRNVKKKIRLQEEGNKFFLSCRMPGIREDSEEAIIGWVLKMKKVILHGAFNKAEASTRYW